MEQINEEKKQQRKKYAAAGERGQKMVSFRLDNDLAEWLAGKPNKGRYLNNLIREHWKQCLMQRPHDPHGITAEP